MYVNLYKLKLQRKFLHYQAAHQFCTNGNMRSIAYVYDNVIAEKFNLRLSVYFHFRIVKKKSG